MSIIKHFFIFLFCFYLFCLPTNSYASQKDWVAAKAVIEAWEQDIYLYKIQKGIYPPSELGLKVFNDDNKNIEYIEKPKDIWGRVIIYIYPSTYGTKDFDLYSVGKNGKDEYGNGDDITNWKPVNEKFYISKGYYFKLYKLLIIFFLILIIKKKFTPKSL